MRGWLGVWFWALTAAGCHGLAPAASRPAPAPAPPAPPELPIIAPVVPDLNAHGLPRLLPRSSDAPEGVVYRQLREVDCLLLASANSSTARLLREEDDRIVRTRCKASDASKNELRRTLREHTALELENRAAADALERFLQLAELEARTDLLRKSMAILDALIARAQSAHAATVRFPLEVAELQRQRSELQSQLEQAELSARLLNLDLRRRLGLPAGPPEEQLWAVGDFAIDSTPIDLAAAVNAAMADRPELRGLRAFQNGLTIDALPDARDLLRGINPLLGSADSSPRLPKLLECWLGRFTGSEAAQRDELETRRRQLQNVIDDQERVVADETRAAALSLNAQRVRIGLANDRLASLEEKLVEARKKLAANQPGAEFLVPQVQLEVFKARSELASEVAAWHQARIRLKAAQGWLVWEAQSRGIGGEKKSP
jgi:hypothetical protein